MSSVKKFKESALSEDTLHDRASKKGFIVIDIDYSKDIPYVLMKCKKGHIKGCKATVIHREDTICQICEGKRFDVPKAKSLLAANGYSFKEVPELEEDRYGNKVIKAAKRFISICPNGHEQAVNLTEFVSGKRCTVCSGTVFNAGYSRSEEIIARVLDYISVDYNRQTSTGVDFGNLHLDFFLPEHKMIIEYDGEHHVYGRSTSTKKQLEDIKRRDNLRNDYARHKGLKMVRINHRYEGKAIVYALANIFTSVDVTDPYYDDIVRNVFNEAADRFGWLTYQDIKNNAVSYLYNSLSDAASITGVSQTVIARHFKWVYGVNKSSYLKNMDSGGVG